MKKSVLLILIILAAMNLRVSSQRGEIIEAIPLISLNPEEIMLNLQGQMDDLNYQLIDYFTYKNYSVQAIKLIYTTIDVKGAPGYASGVVFLPVVGSATEFPSLCYLHGTLTRDTDAPSYLGGMESVLGWIMAMDGYIAILPDYLGMGDGPGIHPYCHAASEASASVDMIKAALHLTQYPGMMVKPDGQLYLSGYSQGGHAALATQRVLEKDPVPGLDLELVVAGSGAYSLSFIQKNFLFKSPEYPNPSFLPYLLLGYQDAYGNLYSGLDDVFVSPYDFTIPGLFDGSLTVEEIDGQLPLAWQSMFDPGYLRDIKYRYYHPVNSALRKNDVINWKPQTELDLFFCTCDELVAKENSLLAYLSFLLKGSRVVSCLPAGPFQHAECGPIVLLLAKIRFDCASGANPCILSLPSKLADQKSTDTKIEGFYAALQRESLVDKNDLYLSGLTSYLDTDPARNVEFSVYPNPASDRVYIEFGEDWSSDASIEVFDQSGKLLWNEFLSDCKNVTHPLNISSLEEGFYIIRISNKDHTFTQKVLKLY